jgi:glutaryl-CoA dehydrogenase
MTDTTTHLRPATELDTEFTRGLGLYASTMVVVGSMIGSGIFIVSADMGRNIGSPGWLLVAWLATGIAVGAYEAALAYAKERIQFGAPIAARQLIQERLVDALGLITSSITLCVRISQLGDADAQKDEHSALAKAVATGNMRKVVALAREVCGGNGIVADYGVGRFFADAEAIYSYEGTREMNTLIVGRSITGHAAFV